MTEKVKALDFFKSPGNSKYQETYAEYSFLKDLMHTAAVNNEKLMVSRSDFDDFGFDVSVGSLAREKVVHIQLKTFGGAAGNWDVHKSLIKDENGRVLIIGLSQKNDEVELEYYLLRSDKKDSATNRPPKMGHPQKCKVLKSDCRQITKENLLDIFDN